MSLHLAIQNAILAEIARPEFSAALPPLSDEAWGDIIDGSLRAHKENERLEFLGDAMMYAALGHQLYIQIPEGSPGLLTTTRSALHSNLTFSRLAEKLDIFAVNDRVLHALTARTFGEGTSAPEKTKSSVKATADLFETVIGSYYLERGYKALCSWVDDLYRPLVVVAKRAYSDNILRPSKKSPRLPPKKLYSPMKPVNVVVKSKRTVLKHPLTNKPILTGSTKASRRSLVPNRIIAPKRPIHRSKAGNSKASLAAVKVKSVFIDLTELEDSDTEANLETVQPTPSPNNSKVMTGAKPAMGTSESDGDSLQDFADETFLEDMLISSSPPLEGY